jgi:hypothetical protein
MDPKLFKAGLQKASLALKIFLGYSHHPLHYSNMPPGIHQPENIYPNPDSIMIHTVSVLGR